VTILPDATANRDQAYANPDIREHIDRALHRVRNCEKSVFALFQMTNDQNPGRKSDQLHKQLQPGKAADLARKSQSGAALCWQRYSSAGWRRGVHEAKCRRATPPASEDSQAAAWS
jgi:hypothetical protein